MTRSEPVIIFERLQPDRIDVRLLFPWLEQMVLYHAMQVGAEKVEVFETDHSFETNPANPSIRIVDTEQHRLAVLDFDGKEKWTFQAGVANVTGLRGTEGVVGRVPEMHVNALVPGCCDRAAWNLIAYVKAGRIVTNILPGWVAVDGTLVGKVMFDRVLAWGMPIAMEQIRNPDLSSLIAEWTTARRYGEKQDRERLAQRIIANHNEIRTWQAQIIGAARLVRDAEHRLQSWENRKDIDIADEAKTIFSLMGKGYEQIWLEDLRYLHALTPMIDVGNKNILKNSYVVKIDVWADPTERHAITITSPTNHRIGSGYFHPHVEREGFPCWGNIVTSVAEAFAVGDFAGLLGVCLPFLRGYNPLNAFIQMEGDAGTDRSETVNCDLCDTGDHYLNDLFYCERHECENNRQSGRRFCEACRFTVEGATFCSSRCARIACPTEFCHVEDCILSRDDCQECTTCRLLFCEGHGWSDNGTSDNVYCSVACAHAAGRTSSTMEGVP